MRDYVTVMTENNPTYLEEASSWELWCEYVDPQGEVFHNEEEFDEMDIDDKIALITECFGIEES
jgi:hypothetical protein